MIEVTDNGKGFPAENRQRLLEPYMTTREGGTGLGLAIVSKIMEEHGGGHRAPSTPPGAAARRVSGCGSRADAGRRERRRPRPNR